MHLNNSIRLLFRLMFSDSVIFRKYYKIFKHFECVCEGVAEGICEIDWARFCIKSTYLKWVEQCLKSWNLSFGSCLRMILHKVLKISMFSNETFVIYEVNQLILCDFELFSLNYYICWDYACVTESPKRNLRCSEGKHNINKQLLGWIWNWAVIEKLKSEFRKLSEDDFA